MDENNEANEIFTSGMLQNLKDNWINIAIILAVLILIIIIVKIISRRIRKLVEKKISDDRIIIKKRTFTFTSVVSNLIIVIAVVAAALITADEIGINVTPLLAGAGVAGVVIGFGAQSLIKDLINGVFILLEQWFQVGDIVTIGDTSGTVERLNLRTTVIRDIEGTVHYIPNGEITKLSNQTQLWSRAVVEVGVHYSEDTDRVVKVLEDVFEDLVNDKNYKKVILERPVILGDGGISELGDSAVVFKIICKVKPGEQWTIARQMRKRIKDKFDEIGIEIPYPCTNVYMRNE
ncbi:MAG: mechanosensitive ion channel family protein, partial [Actinobacteria bacterium]|nr:mechanosensitive ion channel family protein [Actinomycetota bacterium]